MRSYTLNSEAAKAAGVGQRITETGKYVGRITRAYGVVSQKASEGVEIAFEADDGRTADYLTMWTFDADGKELYGFKTLNALMTVLKLRELPAKPGTIEKDGRQHEAPVYPALLQRVGLLLQREDYVKRDGGEGFKFNIVLPFAADTGLTAHEILERKTTAEQADKVASTLTDKKPRKQPGAGYQYGTGGSGLAPHHDGGPAIPDDEIPF